MNNTITMHRVARGAERDEEFGAYVHARRAELLRAATFLVAGDPWEAEDLVQVALARLYVAWRRVRADTVDAYARRCLLNALIDHRRRASTRRERVDAQPPEPTSEDAEQDELRTVVFAALAELPERMRAAVVMRHLLDLSVQETAAAMRCRPGTVKSQTARGLEHLRAALGERGVSVQDVGSGSEATPHDRHAARGRRQPGDLAINPSQQR